MTATIDDLENERLRQEIEKLRRVLAVSITWCDMHAATCQRLGAIPGDGVTEGAAAARRCRDAIRAAIHGTLPEFDKLAALAAAEEKETG